MLILVEGKMLILLEFVQLSPVDQVVQLFRHHLHDYTEKYNRFFCETAYLTFVASGIEAVGIMRSQIFCTIECRI